MRHTPFSCSCLCASTLCLLLAVVGTAIFSFVTLVVFLVFGLIIEALVIITAIFFLVTLIALILFLNCFMIQICRPPDCCNGSQRTGCCN